MQRLFVYILIWLVANAFVGDYGPCGVQPVAAVGIPASPAALFKMYKIAVGKLWPEKPADVAVAAPAPADADADAAEGWANPTIPEAAEILTEKFEQMRAGVLEQVQQQQQEPTPANVDD